MFLFCLLLAYVIVRVSEDVSASVRGHQPPRHEYRMAKLKARQANGGRVPQSSFGRYMTGLIDDAWDSAHHKRQLMAEHRKEKQARKIAAKQQRQQRRWERQDAKRVAKAGFSAEVPTPGEATPASGAAAGQLGPKPGAAAPAGFSAQVPQPGQGPAGSGITEPPHPAPTPTAGSAADTGDNSRSPRDADELDRFARNNPEVDSYASAIAGADGEWDSALFYDAVREMKNAREAQHAREVAAGQPMAGEPGQDPTTGFQIPSEATSACACGTGTQRPVPGSLHADEGDGAAMVGTACDNADCGISSAHYWTPSDEEYRRHFGHGFGDDVDDEPDPHADAKEDTHTSLTSLPTNVIPFKRNPNTVTRMELPVTNPEITGLDSAIAYAQGMASQCTHAYDQISAILPGSDETAASCEQARADLEAGGVSGQPLTDVGSVQEQMTGAITELQAALAQLEAAAAAANSLATELESHRGVQEAYSVTPNAGDKAFVTAE